MPGIPQLRRHRRPLVHALPELVRAHPAAGPAVITPATTLCPLSPEHELALTLRDLRAVRLRMPPGQARGEVCVVQAAPALCVG